MSKPVKRKRHTVVEQVRQLLAEHVLAEEAAQKAHSEQILTVLGDVIQELKALRGEVLALARRVTVVEGKPNGHAASV